MLFNHYSSVLEQFDVLPIFVLAGHRVDFSITNETVMLFLILGFFFVLFQLLVTGPESTMYVIPTRFQSIIELLFKLIVCTIINNIDFKNGQRFFPLVFTVFVFILSSNLIGLIPYTFTVTSHLIVTFAFSLFIFLGINIICVREHGLHFFELFIPSGTSVVLSLILAPIELISFVFKPVSLSIRLFANMMAGHTLLKVIASFAFTLINFSGILFFLHLVPLLLLLPLLCLELAVAVIQSLVFCILICIYLNDAIHLH